MQVDTSDGCLEKTQKLALLICELPIRGGGWAGERQYEYQEGYAADCMDAIYIHIIHNCLTLTQQ